MEGEAPRGRLVGPSAPFAQWIWEMEGPPGAPYVILLHGWMATAALNWAQCLPSLARHFHVVAPNLRGHGRQGAAAPPFSLEGCSDDIAALIEALGARGAIVIGYSMGGAVAQVLGRRHPDLLGGIVLCATAARFAEHTALRPLVRACGAATSRAARSWPRGASSFLRWRLARYDSAAAAAASQPGPPNFVPAPLWDLEERALSHLAAFIESGAELNAYDSRSWLADLDVPAAAVVTERDRVVAPWRQEEMAQLVPGCRRYGLDAGHDAVFAKRDLLLPVLVEACRSLATSPGAAVA